MKYPINKYRNTWTEYNGTKYQSKKEANYARELDLRFKARDIENWERQVPFPIEVNDINVGKYMLDFRVTYPNGDVEYVDVKGMKTDLYKFKKKCVEAQYGIEIKEV